MRGVPACGLPGLNELNESKLAPKAPLAARVDAASAVMAGSFAPDSTHHANGVGCVFVVAVGFSVGLVVSVGFSVGFWVTSEVGLGVFLRICLTIGVGLTVVAVVGGGVTDAQSLLETAEVVPCGQVRHTGCPCPG